MSDVNQTINPPSWLGVIGGGQLGRMFVQAAQRLGYRVVVLSESDDSPAAQVANEVIVGASDDVATLTKFAGVAKGVTVEFENVSAAALRWLAKRVPCRPGWRTVWISQNRLREKSFLAAHHFPAAPWMPVRTPDELSQAMATLGTPLILKTANSGYDGKGQVRIDRTDDLNAGWAALNRVACVAEGSSPSRRKFPSSWPEALMEQAWRIRSSGTGTVGTRCGRVVDRRVLRVRGGYAPRQRACSSSAQLWASDGRGMSHEPV